MEQLHTSFIAYIEYNNIERVKEYLKKKNFDPFYNHNESIIKASEYGRIKILKLLLDDQRTHHAGDRDNEAFIIACTNGNIDIVKLLLTDEDVDVTDRDNEGILIASESGYKDIVKLIRKYMQEITPIEKMILYDKKLVLIYYDINDIRDLRQFLEVDIDDRTLEFLETLYFEGSSQRMKLKKLLDLKGLRKDVSEFSDESEEKSYSSPKEYKSVRKILNVSAFSRPVYDIEFSKDSLEHVKLQNISSIGFSKSYQENKNIIYSKEYRSFLCELETFNWNTNKLENLETMKQTQYHNEYIKHLFNLFGNNSQMFSYKFTDFFGYVDHWMPSIYKNKLVNNPYRFTLDQDFVKERKKNNLPIYYYNPFTLYNFGNEEYSVFYSDELLDTKNIKNRFSFIITNEQIMTQGGHFTFMVIDHRNKIVEYYDPHGKSMSKSKQKVRIIYEAISKLFPGFTIIEFWKNTGIQTTENIEKDEEGFCVTWGIIMIHLKLLNINIKVQDLENMFINECENKKLSLYEVMLNYVYHINRIVLTNSYNYSKIIKLSKFND
jgi:hypothetical protein